MLVEERVNEPDAGVEPAEQLTEKTASAAQTVIAHTDAVRDVTMQRLAPLLPTALADYLPSTVSDS